MRLVCSTNEKVPNVVSKIKKKVSKIKKYQLRLRLPEKAKSTGDFARKSHNEDTA